MLPAAADPSTHENSVKFAVPFDREAVDEHRVGTRGRVRAGSLPPSTCRCRWRRPARRSLFRTRRDPGRSPARRSRRTARTARTWCPPERRRRTTTTPSPSGSKLSAGSSPTEPALVVAGIKPARRRRERSVVAERHGVADRTAGSRHLRRRRQRHRTHHDRTAHGVRAVRPGELIRRCTHSAAAVVRVNFTVNDLVSPGPITQRRRATRDRRCQPGRSPTAL